jgi:flagellar basal-body rod modification protein FlgD
MTVPSINAYATGSTGTGTTGSVNTTGVNTSSSSSTSSSSNSMLDPQAFLQLLVAQLKYQDPSNPTDTSTFMNQTAMLTQVQTMSGMSTTLSSLATTSQAQTATSMIGKQVTYLDDNGMRVSGMVGSADLSSTGATLSVAGKTVPLASVVSVAAAGSTTS